VAELQKHARRIARLRRRLRPVVRVATLSSVNISRLRAVVDRYREERGETPAYWKVLEALERAEGYAAIGDEHKHEHERVRQREADLAAAHDLVREAHAIDDQPDPLPIGRVSRVFMEEIGAHPHELARALAARQQRG